MPDEIQVYVGGSPEGRGQIRGVVARILNEREVVVNRGADHGVKAGMQFAILDSNLEELIDPETGESIGSMDVPKVFVKVTRVSKKFSVASTFRTFTSGGGAFRSLVEPITQVESLETDAPTLKDEREGSRMVRVGDPIMQARHEEYAGWE